MKYSFENKVSDRQFDSIGELMHFIENTPLNSSAKKMHVVSSSKTTSYYIEFTNTKNFDEAKKLLKDGWKDMAQKLEKKLTLATKSEVTKTSPRPKYAVAGYQACVPRYLQGVPESMIYSKRVPVKQKVITINKQVNYMGGITADQIIEESVKALTIICKLEAQGYRVNLNAVTCSSANNGTVEVTRTCIKKANERLSIAKMAFPLVHPSMQRRIIFRYRETNPHSSCLIDSGYGYTNYSANKYFEDKKNAIYYIPPIIEDVDAFMAKLELK